MTAKLVKRKPNQGRICNPSWQILRICNAPNQSNTHSQSPCALKGQSPSAVGTALGINTHNKKLAPTGQKYNIILENISKLFVVIYHSWLCPYGVVVSSGEARNIDKYLSEWL
jgi:hypothetical protein